MLTVAPIAAATTLCSLDPDNFGSSLNPLNIISIAVFGVFTIPLWPTYIPAIILTPLLMKRVASKSAFVTMPVFLLIAVAVPMGALAGVCVLGPVIALSLSDSSATALNWTITGGVSGGLTLTLICLVFRCIPSSESNELQREMDER